MLAPHWRERRTRPARGGGSPWPKPTTPGGSRGRRASSLYMLGSAGRGGGPRRRSAGRTNARTVPCTAHTKAQRRSSTRTRPSFRPQQHRATTNAEAYCSRVSWQSCANSFRRVDLAFACDRCDRNAVPKALSGSWCARAAAKLLCLKQVALLSPCCIWSDCATSTARKRN